MTGRTGKTYRLLLKAIHLISTEQVTVLLVFKDSREIHTYFSWARSIIQNHGNCAYAEKSLSFKRYEKGTIFMISVRQFLALQYMDRFSGRHYHLFLDDRIDLDNSEVITALYKYAPNIQNREDIKTELTKILLREQEKAATNGFLNRYKPSNTYKNL